MVREMWREMWRACSLALLLVLSCVRHPIAPVSKPGEGCACRGHAPKSLANVSRAKLCSEWTKVVDGEAQSHVAFPELDERACFARVRYEKGRAKPDATGPSCGYPENHSLSVLGLHIGREIERYDAIASGSTADLPHELACKLPDADRRRVAKLNAETLRATVRRIATGKRWPYALVSTFGYGASDQMDSGLVDYRPGQACPALSPIQMGKLQPNVTRAGHAADAWHANVGPVIVLTGGAVHAAIVEAYILHYLVTCRFGVPKDAVLLDPCADHTHVNVRNTASLIVAVGGRTGYVVTDMFQAGYLQEWTSFDLIGGSVDQRLLRDFGYLAGAFRQASVGERFGFWLTPYRFFAEPHDGLGGLTCVR